MTITKEQISDTLKAKSDWYLIDQLQVKEPHKWHIILVEDNQFHDKNRIIFGEPEISFFNHLTHNLIVIKFIERINFNSIGTKHEENGARILCNIVADTYHQKTGIKPNKVYSYLIYADYLKIKVESYSNSDLLINLAAIKLCKLYKKSFLSVSELADFMTKNPFVLVHDHPNFTREQWDEFF